MTKSLFRLDYFSYFKPGTVEKMTDIRAKYIELEKALEDIAPDIFTSDICNPNRTYHEALTHLEQSQMYAIKMLCLIGEADD